MSIGSYRDLEVWKVGMLIARAAYLASRRFPKDELFGLTSQIRRAAVSIPANVAEGHGREMPGEFIRSLRISQGSLKELETHCLVAVDCGIVPEEVISELLALTEREGKMLRGLIRSLQDRQQ